MKEKNEAVIANTAIRALCCFRALSFEGFFFFFFCLTTELNLKIVSSKEKKRSRFREKHISGLWAVSWKKQHTVY